LALDERTSLGEPKAHSDANVLRCEIRLEDTAHDLFGHPGAVVADCDCDQSTVRIRLGGHILGGHGNYAAFTRGRISVSTQVQQRRYE
jgi:hypothetical protein